MSELEPAPYSNTDTAESDAIACFETAIDRKHVKAEVRSRDKYPNTDGTVELVDARGVPLGKLEVQIRGTSSFGKTFHYDPSLIAYSERTNNPVLIVAVDLKLQKAYWKHVSSETVSLTASGKHAIAHFTELDRISFESGYLSKWLGIVQDYQTRIRDYRRISAQLEQTIKDQSASGRTSLSQSQIDYYQRFADRLNLLLDTTLRIVKERKFPHTWKVGVAAKPNTTDAQFSLYAIPKGQTDLLVKDLNEDNERYFVTYYRLNPDPNPERMANEFASGFFGDLLKSGGLPIDTGSLMNEYVFNIVARFPEAFGISQRNENVFSLDEVRHGYEEHFWRWVIGALSLYSYPPHVLHLDLDILMMFIPAQERSTIRDRAADPGKAEFPPFFFQTDGFDLVEFENCLSQLQSSGAKSVRGRLPLPDETRLQGKRASFIWDGYTASQASQFIYEYYSSVYEIIDEYCKNHGFPAEFYTDAAHADKVLITPQVDFGAGFGAMGVRVRFLKWIDGPAPTEKYQLVADEATLQKPSRYEIQLGDTRYGVPMSMGSIASDVFHQDAYKRALYDHLTNKAENFGK